MANIEKFSEGLLDLAERFADMTDAAKGRGNRRTQRFGMHWFLLPAAGAGLYRLAASGSLQRQARNMATQAKELASDLPDDLMGRVQEVTDHKSPPRKAGSRSSAQASSGSRSGAARSRPSGARARKSSGRSQGSSGRKRNQARKSRTTSSR